MANVRSAELWAHEMLFGKVLQKPPTITKLNTPNKCPVKMVVTLCKGLFQVGVGLLQSFERSKNFILLKPALSCSSFK